MPVAKKISLQQFTDYCQKNSLPFALYRLPATRAIKVVAQKSNRLKKVSKAPSAASGFIFAPFKEDRHHGKIIIAPDIFTTADKLPELTFATKPAKSTKTKREKIKAASKKQYITYIEEIQTQIHTGKFKKIVAARVVKKAKPSNFNATIFFQNLCLKYPNAFVSMAYTPQYGLWIGATPEILLQADKSGLKTYSLAGTRANTNNTNQTWGAKEQEEQKIVSEYIVEAFKKVTKDKPVIHGPETITAGNLQHLRTTFTYPKTPTGKWVQVVNHLHPTPAVAGLPQKESIAFITAHEKAPRAFYSGYLGPVNLDKQINLFVNLRCMQVLKNKLAIYVGCGITAASNPAAEWKESKMKSQTLLSAL